MAVAASLFTVGAQAQSTLYVGAGLGKVWPDKDARDGESGTGLNLLMGWELGRVWNAELNFGYSRFKDTRPADNLIDFFAGDDGGGSTTRLTLGGDLVWVPLRGWWSPFLLGGLGGARNKGDPDQDSGTNLYMNFGGGVMSAPLGSKGLRLRAEARYVLDQFDGKPKDRQLFIGATFRPGGGGSSTASTPAPRPAPEPAESVAVTPPPAPAPVPAPATPPPVSPAPPASTAPPPAPQATVPAPAPAPALPPLPQLDDDNDGIFSAQDRCPGTLRGMRVDQYGCAVEGAQAVLEGVNFENASTRMDTASTPSLLRLTEALEGQPSMRIELRGHTDSVGDATANQRLSEQRAQSIQRFLVGQGIEAWRITVTGFGSTRPVADNSTAGGRALNRRVEVRVVSP